MERMPGHPSKKESRQPGGGGKGKAMNLIQKMQPIEKPLRPALTDGGDQYFTAIDANEVLKTCWFDGQRKIDQKQVDVLADLMSRDKWRAKDQINVAVCGSSNYLVNGYHRMRAQIQSGKTILWNVAVHYCDDMDQVRSLYYSFDTNTRRRGPAQILDAINFPETVGISKTMGKALFNAIPIIASGFSKAHADRDHLTTRIMDRRLTMAQEYMRAARIYDEILTGKPIKTTSRFRVAGVTAVALVTLRYQPVAATEFWRGTVENDGLRKGDPRLALHNDLISRSMNTGSAVQSIYAPSYAWNAWYENREIKIIKVYARSRASISGTPFEA